MSPSEPWVDAWLNNMVMPPHAFPPALLQPLFDRAERWLTSSDGPREQFEEFAGREETCEVMDGLPPPPGLAGWRPSRAQSRKRRWAITSRLNVALPWQ